MSMSSGLKNRMVKTYAMMQTRANMMPNWRKGSILEPVSGSTEHNVLKAAAVIDAERARNAARDL